MAGVDAVLRGVGLLDVLERVTGEGEALHAAARVWLGRAVEVQEVAAQLKKGAVALSEVWEGDASAAFGGFMGRFVSELDALAVDLAETARVLNEAGVAAGVAEDLVTGIIADAAEWAAAELAATVIADVFTLGLASIAGGLAESATLAVFVERAAKSSADFGRTLEELVWELDDLKEAREAIRGARGLRKLHEVTKARTELDGLRMLGSASKVLNSWADKTAGAALGLPLYGRGAQGFAMDVGKTIADVVGSGADPGVPRR